MRKIRNLFAAVFVTAICVFLCRWLYASQQSRFYSGYETAKVVYVIDGDTAIVQIEDKGGSHTETEVGKQYRVRFLGIDCEESASKNEAENTEKGREAAAFTKELLSGATVYLQKDTTELDRYDRLLRYVWLREPERPEDAEFVREFMVNGILLDHGLAREMWLEPDLQYQEIFGEIASEAEQEVGQ